MITNGFVYPDSLITSKDMCDVLGKTNFSPLSNATSGHIHWIPTDRSFQMLIGLAHVAHASTHKLIAAITLME